MGSHCIQDILSLNRAELNSSWSCVIYLQLIHFLQARSMPERGNGHQEKGWWSWWCHLLSLWWKIRFVLTPHLRRPWSAYNSLNHRLSDFCSVVSSLVLQHMTHQQTAQILKCLVSLQDSTSNTQAAPFFSRLCVFLSLPDELTSTVGRKLIFFSVFTLFLKVT